MPTPEEIRWIKTTANELNNLLQVISESTELLERISSRTSDTNRYFAILRNSVSRAGKVTQMMIDRVGGFSVDANPHPGPTIPPAAPPRVTLPPSEDVAIYNPDGPLELLMIVDDEEFVTLLARRLLADRGYRVITASSGMRAVEIYRKLRDQISLVILDFTMPVMDGSEVFDELLEIEPNVPVVLSSGFAEPERVRTMLAKGLRGFIPKPYTEEKLLSQIRTTLDVLRAEKTGERRVL